MLFADWDPLPFTVAIEILQSFKIVFAIFCRLVIVDPSVVTREDAEFNKFYDRLGLMLSVNFDFLDILELLQNIFDFLMIWDQF